MKRALLSKRLLILLPLLSLISLTGGSPAGREVPVTKTAVDSAQVREIRITNKDKLTKITYEVQRIAEKNRP